MQERMRGRGGTAVAEAPVVRGRILLAGGHPAQSTMITRALETQGYEVAIAGTGRETVLALIHEPADLLLVNAPLADGSVAALLRWMRARHASAHTTCMVLCSPDSAAEAAFYDAGADLVETRGIDLELLPRKVSAVLARRTLALAG